MSSTTSAIIKSAQLDIAKSLTAQHHKVWIAWTELKKQFMAQLGLQELTVVQQIWHPIDNDKLFFVERHQTCVLMLTIVKDISSFERMQMKLQYSLLHASEIEVLAVFTEEWKQLKRLEKNQKRGGVKK